jgi:hypothetical protein
VPAELVIEISHVCTHVIKISHVCTHVIKISHVCTHDAFAHNKDDHTHTKYCPYAHKRTHACTHVPLTLLSQAKGLVSVGLERMKLPIGGSFRKSENRDAVWYYTSDGVMRNGARSVGKKGPMATVRRSCVSK